MIQPFIRNHQFNVVKKQTNLLQTACNTVSDPRVVDAVRSSTVAKIIEAFPHATELALQSLTKVSALKKTEEFQHFLHELEPQMTEWTPVTVAQIKKLFPKVKKLKLPDLAAYDYRYMTYMGWTDVAANRMFLLYRQDEQLIGIEGKMTPVQKKGVCFLCNRHAEVALFSAVTKFKPANASPDYYKAIGNYMCVSSEACNSHIADVTALEKFIGVVLGR